MPGSANTYNEVLPYGQIQYLSGLIKQSSTRWQAKKQLKKDGESTCQKDLAPVIAYPEPRKKLIKELANSIELGTTPDGKQIYLFDYRPHSSLMREIGRLREVAFRSVGEGTMKARDVDGFDKYYRHIVLWDSQALEVVGAYRIGEAFNIYAQRGISGLYTHRLFDYKPQFISLFPQAIELGRSFIQPKYWGKRGLDYLWQGIGAYLKAYPQVRYLFGAVSISNDYPVDSISHIINYYSANYQGAKASNFATARNPYNLDKRLKQAYADIDSGEGIKQLKAVLKSQSCRVPTLYKHYAEFCASEGTQFIDFNIDPEFCDCVDSLVLVDLRYIKAKKQQRYIDVHNQ